MKHTYCDACKKAAENKINFVNYTLCEDCSTRFLTIADISRISHSSYKEKIKLNEMGHILAVLVLQSDAYRDPDIRDAVDNFLAVEAKAEEVKP